MERTCPRSKSGTSKSITVPEGAPIKMEREQPSTRNASNNFFMISMIFSLLKGDSIRGMSRKVPYHPVI
jgi:hypothetical protein